MRNTKKKKLNFKKIRIASMEEVNTVKGGNTQSCAETCDPTCDPTVSTKTYPLISVYIPCLNTLFC